MNKARRDAIQKIITAVTAAKAELEGLIEEEQEYYENLPAGFQAGSRGQQSEDAISSMEQAETNLEETITELQNAIEV